MSGAERRAVEIKMNKKQLLDILNKNREKIILARYLTFPENEREKFEDKYLDRKKTKEIFY